MADKETGEVFESAFTLDGVPCAAYPISANKDGVAFAVWMPYILMEGLEKGEIKNPQLKQIAGQKF